VGISLSHSSSVPLGETVAILSGWKEISKYMGHGVRTVQRWEVIGLPVHRPRGTNRSAVIAFTEELEIWSHASPVKFIDEIANLKAEIESLKDEVRALNAARRTAS
jgi:hypothetical protein